MYSGSRCGYLTLDLAQGVQAVDAEMLSIYPSLLNKKLTSQSAIQSFWGLGEVASILENRLLHCYNRTPNNLPENIVVPKKTLYVYSHAIRLPK